MQFKPLLASKLDEQVLQAHFDAGNVLLMSPKLDGIRTIMRDSTAYARSLKPIPNAALQERFGRPELDWYDGEFICGDANSPTVYRDTFSAVMGKLNDSTKVRLFAFDHVLTPGEAYSQRYQRLQGSDSVVLVPQTTVASLDHVLAAEKALLEQGYEGAMLRHPGAPYKMGRSTPRELILMKVKREQDDDGLVVDIYEAMHNANEAFTDELGRTARSTHQENLVGLGIAGGFVLEFEDLVFNCSMGQFNHAERKWIWENRQNLIGNTYVKFRHFTYGVKELPRFPRALGFRDPLDMS